MILTKSIVGENYTSFSLVSFIPLPIGITAFDGGPKAYNDLTQV
jgi:hypothetical protein